MCNCKIFLTTEKTEGKSQQKINHGKDGKDGRGKIRTFDYGINGTHVETQDFASLLGVKKIEIKFLLMVLHSA